jgi:hypothetical protein
VLPRRVLQVIGAAVGHLRLELHFPPLLRASSGGCTASSLRQQRSRRSRGSVLGSSFTGAVLLVAAEELPRGLSQMTMPPDGLAYGAVRCRPPDSDEPDREAPNTARVGARAGGAAMHCACVKRSGQRGESTPWPHAASGPSMSWSYHQVHGRSPTFDTPRDGADKAGTLLDAPV